MSEEGFKVMRLIAVGDLLLFTGIAINVSIGTACVVAGIVLIVAAVCRTIYLVS